MKTVVCQSVSPGVTQAYAEKLIHELTGGGSMLLEGNLGSGKTTFVQGIGRALHIEQSITSPTFTLMSVYETQHPIIKQLVHLDLYRINNVQDTHILDITTLLKQAGVLVIVEWPERAAELWEQFQGNLLGTIQFSLGHSTSDRSLTISGSIVGYF